MDQREAAKMRRRGLGLIIILLYHLYSTMAAPSAVQKALPTDSHYQQTDPTEGYGKKGVSNRFGTGYDSSLISHQGFGHGSTNGGGDTGAGGRSPHSGGTAVIPIYAAGSAHHRQDQHHNVGNRNENSIGLLVAAVLASIAHLARDFGR